MTEINYLVLFDNVENIKLKSANVARKAGQEPAQAVDDLIYLARYNSGSPSDWDFSDHAKTNVKTGKSKKAGQQVTFAPQLIWIQDVALFESAFPSKAIENELEILAAWEVETGLEAGKYYDENGDIAGTAIYPMPLVSGYPEFIDYLPDVEGKTVRQMLIDADITLNEVIAGLHRVARQAVRKV